MKDEVNTFPSFILILHPFPAPPPQTCLGDHDRRGWCAPVVETLRQLAECLAARSTLKIGETNAPHYYHQSTYAPLHHAH